MPAPPPRGTVQLRLADGYVGSGKIEGAGLYLDSAMRTRSPGTAAIGTGFLATFAYIKVMLVDAKTMAVIREQNAEESTTLSPAFAFDERERPLWVESGHL